MPPHVTRAQTAAAGVSNLAVLASPVYLAIPVLMAVEVLAVGALVLVEAPLAEMAVLELALQ